MSAMGRKQTFAECPQWVERGHEVIYGEQVQGIDLISGSERTVALAPVVGGYLIVSAAGLLRNGELRSFLSDLEHHPAALHAVGAVAFFVGAFILTFQRSWSWPTDLALNLVAAWWLFEGAGMLASPRLLRGLFRRSKGAFGIGTSIAVAAAMGIFLLAVAIVGNVR
jgi:hypothetical protein